MGNTYNNEESKEDGIESNGCIALFEEDEGDGDNKEGEYWSLLKEMRAEKESLDSGDDQMREKQQNVTWLRMAHMYVQYRNWDDWWTGFHKMR